MMKHQPTTIHSERESPGIFTTENIMQDNETRNMENNKPETPPSPSGSPFSGLKLTGRGPSLRPAKLIRSAAKDAILDAVEFLEKENEQLRTVNMSVIKEMNEVKNENERLRNEMKTILGEKKVLLSKIGDVEKDSNKMSLNMKEQAQMFEEVKKEKDDIKDKLLQENAKHVKQIENLRVDIAQKEAELKRRVHEMENMRQNIEESTRNSMHERRMELLYEMEMLKGEKKELTLQKDEIQKLNIKLHDEMKDLENTIEEQVCKLRNENRRHSLLTKEFNSLLEENNRLKLQLRRRTLDSKTNLPNNVWNVTAEPSDSVIVSTSRIDTFSKKNHQPLNRKISLPTDFRRSHTTIMNRNNTAVRHTSMVEGLPVLPSSHANGSWKP